MDSGNLDCFVSRNDRNTGKQKKICRKIKNKYHHFAVIFLLSFSTFHLLTHHNMSNSLNKVQLIGNLTAEPEVRETPNGQKVATFSVATNRKWKDASGMLQEEVEYHNCVAWRGLADIAEQYMHKWKKVYVEGYLKTRSWDDTAGVKRYKTEIVSDNVILLSSPGGATGGDSYSQTDAAPQEMTAPRKSKAKAEESISIEDIPF